MTPAERRAAAIRKTNPIAPAATSWGAPPPPPPTRSADNRASAAPPPEPASSGAADGPEPDVHAGSHVHPVDHDDVADAVTGLGDGNDQSEGAAPGLDDHLVSVDDIDENDGIATGVDEAEQAVVVDLDRLQSERDDYLDQLLRTRAEFDNYRKRMRKQQTENSERAAEALAEKLLEVLDTFDAAVQHGAGFEQGHTQLVAVLEKQGLERIDPAGQEFDPTEADAVAHEEGDEGPVVSAVLRPGYRWKGRVLRPAMVKVKG